MTSPTNTSDCPGNMSDMYTTMMTPPRRPPASDNRVLIIYILSTVIIAIGMIGIGASVHYKTLWNYIKRPKAYLLGVLMQLLIVPPMAWALTRIFVMPIPEALGVFIQGACPGGTTSNVVVYWMDGVIDLSVAMTATSTLLALGTMPLWLFIYSKGENLSDDLNIPFDRLAISLAALIVPIFIGMVIKVKFPKKAPIISKVLIIMASLFIVIMVIVNSIVSQIPWRVTWRQGVVAAIMPLIAFLFGYLATLIPGLGLTQKCRRTVAIETALQNVQVAAAVIQISFGGRLLLLIQMLLFPLLYYVFQVGYSALFAGLFFLAKRRGWVALESEEAESSPETGKDNPTFQEEASPTVVAGSNVNTV